MNTYKLLLLKRKFNLPILIELMDRFPIKQNINFSIRKKKFNKLIKNKYIKEMMMNITNQGFFPYNEYFIIEDMVFEYYSMIRIGGVRGIGYSHIWCLMNLQNMAIKIIKEINK